MQTGSTHELASLGSRFLALLIDAVILGIIGFIVNSLIGGQQVTTSATGATVAVNSTGSIISFIIGAVYYAVLFQIWNGQSVGKKLLGIRVIKTDGSSATAVTGIIRYIGYYIDTFVIFIGWIWAFFDSKKQGWHDKLAGTIVVKA